MELNHRVETEMELIEWKREDGIEKHVEKCN